MKPQEIACQSADLMKQAQDRSQWQDPLTVQLSFGFHKNVRNALTRQFTTSCLQRNQLVTSVYNVRFSLLVTEFDNKSTPFVIAE